MTDVIEVAVTAIYLSKGYLLAEKATPGKIMLSDGGQVETMGEIADFAEVQERWYVDRGHEGEGCPGVYAYEFTEPMGAWLYEQYGLPTTEEFIAELDRRWAEWVGPRFRYEVQPCIDEGGNTLPCPESEAAYWGVYERAIDGPEPRCAVWVADFARREDAMVFRDLLMGEE